MILYPWVITLLPRKNPGKENKAMVRRIIKEAINRGNLAVIDEIMAPSYVYHFPGMEIKGPEGFRQFATMMRTAFPDIHVTIYQQLGISPPAAYS